MDINIDNGKICMNSGVDTSKLPIVPPAITQAKVDNFDYVAPTFTVVDGSLFGGNLEAFQAFNKIMENRQVEEMAIEAQNCVEESACTFTATELMPC